MSSDFLNTQPQKRRRESIESEPPKIITSFVPTSLKTKSLNQTYSTPTPVNPQFQSYEKMKVEEISLVPDAGRSYDSFPVIPDEYDVRNPNVYDISKQEILKEISEEKNRKYLEEQKEREKERRRLEKLEEEKAIEDMKRRNRNPFSRDYNSIGRGRGRGREMTLPAWMMKDVNNNKYMNNNSNDYYNERNDDNMNSNSNNNNNSYNPQIENNLIVSKDTSPTPTCVLLIRNMVTLENVDINVKYDVKNKCNQFGRVKKVIVHKTPNAIRKEDEVRIFVCFESETDARAAYEGLSKRRYDNHRIDVDYYDEIRYKKLDFDPII